MSIFYDQVEDIIRRIVGAMVSEVPHPRRGIISSVNPKNMTARVQVATAQGTHLTGWLPIGTPCMQNGWGVIAAPPIGAQCIIMPMEGDQDSAVVWGCHWSNVQQPPGGYAVGEMWLFHASGAFLKVDNAGGVIAQDQHGAKFQLAGDGTVVAVDPTGSTLELLNNKTAKLIDGFGSSFVLNGDGTAALTANLTINGSLTMNTGVVTLQDGVEVDTHVHLVPAPVSGDTGPPLTS